MKSNKVFIADLYATTNYNEEYIAPDCGNITFDTYLVKKNIHVIKMGAYYVPVMYIKNLISYLELKTHLTHKGNGVYMPEGRFFTPDHPVARGNGAYLIKDVRPANITKSRISLKELKQNYNGGDSISFGPFEETTYGGITVD